MAAVVWKEIRVSVLCGLCLAVANFAKMMLVDHWLMHNPEVTPMVALVVCLTLVFTVLCAKVVGCTLPMVAERSASTRRSWPLPSSPPLWTPLSC